MNDIQQAMRLHTMYRHMIASAKAGSRSLYLRSYVGGHKVISCREPTGHTISLTLTHSYDYAKQAGVSVQTGLRHLRWLAANGMLFEQRGHVTRFVLNMDDARRIGREHIAELEAEGYPHEDQWRAEQAAKKEAT